MDNNLVSPIMLFWRQNELICKKSLEQCLAQDEYPISGVTYYYYYSAITICSKYVLFMTAKHPFFFTLGKSL